MQHYKINWLLSSAPTHENISLSAQFQYSLSSCIGQLIHFSGLETSSWPDCAYRLNLLFGDSGLSIHSSPSSFFTFNFQSSSPSSEKCCSSLSSLPCASRESPASVCASQKNRRCVHLQRSVCILELLVRVLGICTLANQQILQM